MLGLPSTNVAQELTDIGTPKAVQRYWGPFVAAAFTLLVLLAGPNIPTPLYRSYEHAFGFSPLVTALIFATYALVLIPALLVFGPLSDAVGRRSVLLPAIGLAIVGSLLFAVAQSTAWLFAARAVQGLALGAAQGTASAALTDTDPDNDKSRASLVSSLAVVGGIGAGPLLGGVLGQYAPAPRELPYLVETLLLAIVLIALLRLLPRDSAAGVRWRPSRPTVPSSIRRPFVIAGISTFVAWSTSALFLTLMPSYVSQIAATNNLAVVGGVVALMLGCSAAVQPPLRRLSALRTQTLGLVLLAVGLFGIVAAAQTASLAVVLAATVVTGCGQGLAFGGSLAAVNAVAPRHRRGDILSSYYVVVYAGVGLPIIGVGSIASAIGLLSAAQIFAYAIIAICLAGLLAHRLQKTTS